MSYIWPMFSLFYRKFRRKKNQIWVTFSCELNEAFYCGCFKHLTHAVGVCGYVSVYLFVLVPGFDWVWVIVCLSTSPLYSLLQFFELHLAAAALHRELWSLETDEVFVCGGICKHTQKRKKKLMPALRSRAFWIYAESSWQCVVLWCWLCKNSFGELSRKAM